ncbi:TRAP-type C4-dicarboxylate transport system, substrate-binding protein [Pseudomonas oryzae]|uniref:TRAP-type C4-dicarboxylate transport system, substrate-binding protein n=1 Tax=Pseudomonas oryzae TaxID=1392877 RepID=A0A1H1QMN9_9PSED|nr:TRAP-type C4-dicarboxylate transport system, substrate-binding protein [Pseudomonas oryzae]
MLDKAEFIGAHEFGVSTGWMGSEILRMILLFILLVFSFAATASSGEKDSIILKIHHFMPHDSFTQREFLQPWADKITRESGGRIRFHFFPEMQLGGKPTQLIDQTRSGTADVVWALPGYSSGAYPLTGVFELPFMNQSAEASSQALWDFLEKNGQREYQGIKLLATHITDSAVLHTRKHPIRTIADFAALRIRTSNAVQSRMISLFGGQPQIIPINQLPAALARGLVDGAVVPWDVATSVKLQERVKFHSETAPEMPKLMYSALVLAMSKARYDSLPADLQQIIDANSGRTLSGYAGRLWDTYGTDAGHRLAYEKNNDVLVLDTQEQNRWMELARSLDGDWVSEAGKQGYANGIGLLKEARQMVEKYNSVTPASPR